ncbi:MAG: dihydrodipicolinate synthase family protein, partial [Clostridia bacterium]|nr:dihydrodipicolinate synthase family protein [Clostridia bacterium]
VYNVPSRTGVDLTPETCKALSEHKNICAVKEASGNLAKAGAITALCGDSLAVYSGNDDVTVPVMSVGGKGVISVAGNIIPETMHEITKAAIKNDFQKAAALQAQVLDLMQALFLEINPISVKSAVEMLYSMPQALRLPLTGMSEKNRKVLQTVLERHSLV